MATGLLGIIVALWLVGHVGIIAGRLVELVTGGGRGRALAAGAAGAR